MTEKEAEYAEELSQFGNLNNEERMFVERILVTDDELSAEEHDRLIDLTERELGYGRE